MRYLLSVLTLFVFQTTFANTPTEITLSQLPYLPAEQELQRYLNNIPGQPLKGQINFLSVPLNYRAPQAGTMKISYRLAKPLDPKKPSLFYFYGGPGGSSFMTDIDTKLEHFNVIYMDQRGTGFSRPPTLDDLKNPDNFSSEFIARDAAELIKFLQLEKVSAYGQSYGTIPATVFANLFPELTRALVLEGVIWTGGKDLWTAPHRVKILQKFFDQLPQETKTEILALSQAGHVPSDWFAMLGQQAMYSNDFQAQLMEDFKSVLGRTPSAQTAFLSQRLGRNFMFTDSVYYGAFMFHQIACQELSANEVGSTWSAEFVNGKLTPTSKQMTSLCLTLPGMESHLGRTYFANQYHTKVPVTYFQGTFDGATEAPSAIRHYKNVPEGFAQLILVKRAGHAPVLGCLMNTSEPMKGCPEMDKLSPVLDKAFLGQAVSKEDLAAISPAKNWVMTSKGH